MAPAVGAARAQQASDASDAYRIKRGDTLGAIARKWKPEGVTFQQMLMGLYQTNRPAFIRDNINLIRAGATLFIPGQDDVLAISAADAKRQVNTHMAEFSRYRRDYAARAGAGSAGVAQSQREVISRRTGVRKSTRAM
ncbi:MAG: type IV pilus assembly protein FimV [Burkholderiales bacterium]